MARPPTFRWNVLSFVAVTAVVLVVAVALLVLLDPRSQAWWGDRLSELGTFVRSVIDAIVP